LKKRISENRTTEIRRNQGMSVLMGGHLADVDFSPRIKQITSQGAG
jgi:hypothetical protein